MGLSGHPGPHERPRATSPRGIHRYDVLPGDEHSRASAVLDAPGIPALTRWLVNLPSAMMALFIRISAGLRAPGDYAVSIREENAARGIRTGTLPIGLAGLLPLIFIIVLFCL